MSSELVIKALNSPVRGCTRKAITVSQSEPASALIYLMVRNDIGAIVVVEKEKPIGIITEKDVLERVVMENRDMYSTKAIDIMSKPVAYVEADNSVRNALKLMNKYQIRRLAVIDKGILIGIVTERRLSMEFLNQII